MISHQVLVVATKFFSLADKAMNNGGFWVSASGGTARIVVAEIARATGLSRDEVKDGLELVGGQEWYAELYQRQQPSWLDNRWSIQAVIRASLRGAK